MDQISFHHGIAGQNNNVLNHGRITEPFSDWLIKNKVEVSNLFQVISHQHYRIDKTLEEMKSFRMRKIELLFDEYFA